MRSSVVIFILIGIVAMLADMVYEGGRSVLGPYMEFLEASMLVVGAVSIGDVIGYLFRGLSGALAYRLGGRAWVLLLAGYGLNVAVPLLAYLGDPMIALILIVVERSGKGIRAPVKDALIADLTEHTRIRGIAYGVHEVLDQTGAVLGPFIVAYRVSESYTSAYTILWIPYMASMVVLGVALLLYRRISKTMYPRGDTIPWGYIISVSLPMAGFMHWALAGYVMGLEGVGPATVAIAYTLAMLVDVVAAIPLSLLYRRVGDASLLVAPLMSGLASIAVIKGGVLVAGAFWGLAMVVYETIVKAGLADRVPSGSRFYSFGMLGLAQGLAWTIGNMVMSILSDNEPLLILYILAVQLASVVVLYKSR